MDFPYGIVFKNSPLETIENEKSTKTTFGPSIKTDWKFMDFQNTTNPEFKLQQSSIHKKDKK